MVKFDTTGQIVKVIQLMTNSDGLCTIKVVLDDKLLDVEVVCVASLGWIPDKDDIVRIYELDGVVCCEPDGWAVDVPEDIKEEQTVVSKKRVETRQVEIKAEEKAEVARIKKVEKDRIEEEKILKKLGERGLRNTF